VLYENIVHIKWLTGIYFLDKNGIFDGEEPLTIDKLRRLKPKATPYELVVRAQIPGKSRLTTLHFGPGDIITRSTGIAAGKRIELLDALKADRLAGKIRKVPTLDELYAKYIEHRKNGANQLNEKTIGAYNSYYKRLIGPAIGAMRVDKIEFEDVQSILDDMRCKGYSASSQSHLKHTLSPIMLYAMKMRYRNDNPVFLTETEAVRNVKEFALSETDAKRVYQTILDTKDPAERAFLLFLFTGRRRNCEATRIRWEDVDLANGKYTLTGKANSKNKTDKQFPLIAPLIEALKQMGVKESGFLFHLKGDKDKKISGEIAYAHWNRVKKASGVNMNAHECRNLIGHVLKTADFVSNDHLGYLFGHARGGTSVTERYAFGGFRLVKKLTERYIELIENGGWETTDDYTGEVGGKKPHSERDG
jgi:integrase